MRRVLLTSMMLSLVAGCARLPPVDYSYYPAQGAATISVVQSYDCSKDQKRLVIVTTMPTVTTQYSANHTVEAWKVEISRTRGEFTDTDFTMTYYDDGRLKGINSVSTGQGEAVLKSAISLATAVLPLIGGSGKTDARSQILPVCAVIANWGKGKPVSLTFGATLDFTNDAGVVKNLDVTPDGETMFADLKGKSQLIDKPQARLVKLGKPIVPAATSDGKIGNDYIPLKLQNVYAGTLTISTSGGTPIWVGNVLVPDAGYYELPIAKAALFGKSTVVINVGESGAVTSIRYAKETGASGALNVLGAAATAAAPDSAATKAAEVKGQADLIVQSQRLARCQAQPDQCQ